MNDTSDPKDNFITNGNNFLFYTSTSDIIGVMVSFGVQLLLMLVIFIVFSCVRVRAKNVYSPKPSQTDLTQDPKRPSMFDWIKETILAPLEQEDLGLDALMYLKFLRFLCIFYGGLSVFSIPLTIFHGLSPVIAKANNQTTTFNTDQANVTIVKNPQLDALTMANMSLNPAWFMIYVVLAYLYTFFMFYLLYHMWEEFILLRRKWFLSKEYQSDQSHYILLATNLPRSLSKNTANLVAFMQQIKPIAIKRIMHGKSYDDLPEMISQHTEYIFKLERLVNKYLSDPDPSKKKPRIYPHGILGLLSNEKKVDAIQYYKDKLHFLEERIYEKRYLPDETFENDSSAFIVYDSIEHAHTVAQVASHSTKVKELTGRTVVPKVCLCPSQKDLAWRNLGYHRKERRIREFVSFVFVCGIILLWTMMLTVIITITNLDYLVQFRNFTKSTATIILFQYILAPVAFVVLNYTMLPMILRLMAKLQGITSKTKREQTLLYQYFAFQVFQMAYFIAISVIIKNLAISYDRFDIQILFENSKYFFAISVESFVNSSTFYLTTILVSFGGYAIEIVQAIPLLVNMATRWMHLTPRQRFHYAKAPRFDYMLYYGCIFVTFMVSFVYSIVAPLIVPFAFLLFIVVYFVMKYQMLHVYETGIESGGSWFRCVFHLTCICAFLFQLLTCSSIVFICVYRSDGTRGIIQTALVSVLGLFTILYWTWIMYKFYDRSEYIHMDNESSRANEMLDMKFDSLENSLFNPVIAKPLKQVWVNTSLKHQVSTIYTSLYRDMSDYIETKGLEPGLAVRARLISRMRSAFKTKSESFSSLEFGDKPPELDRSNDSSPSLETIIEKSPSTENM